MIAHPTPSLTLRTLSQEQPSGQYGNTGFKAQDKRRHSGVHSLLSYNLQSVSYAAGHNACIQNGNPGVQKPEREGLSKSRAGIPERTPHTKNWMQDIFTPSASGEK